MRIIGWGASDVGRKRNHNEDSFLCNNELGLYAVADGMGGHLGGERASRMAVEILEREIAEVRKAGQLDAAPDGRGARRAAPGRRAAAQGASSRPTATSTRRRMANPELAGMGTTLTALLFARRLRPPGARRRLARLPVPRRPRAPAQRGSLVDPGAGARRPDLARGGEGVALPQHHHALGRLRAERRARPAGAGRPGGRLLRALLGRPVELPDRRRARRRC